MILFLGRHLIGVLECQQLTPPNKIALFLANPNCSLLQPEKSSSRLSGGCAIVITTGKKSSSHLSGGCVIVITTGKKSSCRLSGGCAIIITTGKKSSSRLSGGLCCCVSFWFWRLGPEKKVLVVCLAGCDVTNLY